MSRLPSPASLNFIPQVLFPNILNASQDPMCEVIADVIKVLVEKLLDDGSEIDQQQLLDDAKQKYTLLSGEKILSISEASQRVSGFVHTGVDFEIAKLYVGYLVSPGYENEWRDFEV